MDKEKIMLTLQEHMNEAEKVCNLQMIYAALYGSQNYGLSTEKSDVDSKIVVVPGLHELIMSPSPYSKQLMLPSGEVSVVQDIRRTVHSLKQQNINFMEMLFTEYYHDYCWYFAELREYREDIARYDPIKAVDTMKGMGRSKYDALTKVVPSTQYEIEMYGYSAKNLHHLLRLRDFAENYVLDFPYKYCLTHYKDREFLMAVKAGELPFGNAMFLADTTMKELDAIDASGLRVCDYTQKLVDNLFDIVVEESIKDQVKEEVRYGNL